MRKDAPNQNRCMDIDTARENAKAAYVLEPQRSRYFDPFEGVSKPVVFEPGETLQYLLTVHDTAYVTSTKTQHHVAAVPLSCLELWINNTDDCE